MGVYLRDKLTENTKKRTQNIDNLLNSKKFSATNAVYIRHIYTKYRYLRHIGWS